jgi:hypothetical protein
VKNNEAFVAAITKSGVLRCDHVRFSKVFEVIFVQSVMALAVSTAYSYPMHPLENTE